MRQIINLPLLKAPLDLRSGQNAEFSNPRDDESFSPRLRTEARRDIIAGLVITVICLSPFAVILLTGNLHYMFNHSKLTMIMLYFICLLGLYAIGRLIATPWLIHRRMARPILTSPTSSVNEYLRNVANAEFNSLSYSCLSPDCRLACGGQERFAEIWRGAIKSFKKVNQDVVEAQFPGRYHRRKITALSYDMVSLDSEPEHAAATVRLWLLQYYEYCREPGFEGSTTEYLDGPVFFEMTIKLSRSQGSWYIDSGVPDLDKLEDLSDRGELLGQGEFGEL